MSAVDYGILAPAWAATGAADLVDDNALLTAMLATEVALAEAQAELGVIPAGAAVAIRAAAVPAPIDLAHSRSHHRGPVRRCVRRRVRAPR